MKTFKFLVLALFCSMAPISHAKVKVITTTTDLRSVVEEVGGSLVVVESLAKGTQDTHFIEAKPSFIPKVALADLIVSVGLDLEVGWLPNIISGARNPKINPGTNGYLEVGPLVEPLDVPSGKVTRADGDVHPGGNPHVNLDPLRLGQIAVHIGKRLGEIDPDHAKEYSNRATQFQERMKKKTKDWQARLDKAGVKKVVTYHKTLTYFLNRFGIENPTILEPKPGIPPTSGHIIKVIQVIKEQKVPLILVENFFDPGVTKKIKQAVDGLRVEVIPVAVGGDKNSNSVDELFEVLVKRIEGK